MEAVQFVETELARFPATISKFGDAPYSRYKIEFIVEHEYKNVVWPCTDERGLEVVVAVYRKRAVGVLEPQMTNPQVTLEVDSTWVVGDGTD